MLRLKIAYDRKLLGTAVHQPSGGLSSRPETGDINLHEKNPLGFLLPPQPRKGWSLLRTSVWRCGGKNRFAQCMNIAICIYIYI